MAPNLFIPLKGEYFEAFERKEKTSEYRPYGPRWNESTCKPGREVILSHGYGAQRRLKAKIAFSRVCDPTEAFLSIYGRRRCFEIGLVNIEPE